MNNMEEKSTGTVQITSAEYRELVEKAVREELSASEYRSKCWKLESELKTAQSELANVKSELDKTTAELLKAQEEVARLRVQLNAFVPSYPPVTNLCGSNRSVEQEN